MVDIYQKRNICNGHDSAVCACFLTYNDLVICICVGVLCALWLL